MVGRWISCWVFAYFQGRTVREGNNCLQEVSIPSIDPKLYSILIFFHWLFLRSNVTLHWIGIYFQLVFLLMGYGPYGNPFFWLLTTTLRESSNIIVVCSIILSMSPRRIASFAQSHQSSWCGGHCPCCWPVQDYGMFACRRVEFMMGKWGCIKIPH